jgi:hypothetical protein
MGFLALMPNGKSILDPREEKSCPPPPGCYIKEYREGSQDSYSAV